MYYTNIKDYEHLIHPSQKDPELVDATIGVAIGIIAAIISISILLFNNIHQLDNHWKLPDNVSLVGRVVINQGTHQESQNGNPRTSRATYLPIERAGIHATYKVYV